MTGSLARTRWAAIGAAIAVSLGGGGAVFMAHATGTPSPTTFVPIVPCRLMDTRSDLTVGPRSTHLDAGETYSPLVWGTNANCTIPSSALAVSMNATMVNPTALETWLATA